MNLWRLIRNRADRAAAILAALGGAVAILVGWLGVSRSALPSAQLPYLASGAVFGLFLVALAATLWLSADIRDEWHKLDEIHRDIRAVQAPTVTKEPIEPAPQAEESRAKRSETTSRRRRQ